MTGHPQRCETCKHAKKTTLDGSKIRDNHFPIIYECSKQNGAWMPECNWTTIVGCASHSSAVSGKSPGELEKGTARVDITFPQITAISPDEWKDLKKKVVHPKDGEKLIWRQRADDYHGCPVGRI